MKVYVRNAAREDILRQYRYYLIEKNAAETAEKFLNSIQSAIDALTRNPGLGSPRQLAAPELNGLRSWPVRGFPSMRIYYLYTTDELRIIRVLHGKRDLGPLLEASRNQD